MAKGALILEIYSIYVKRSILAKDGGGRGVCVEMTFLKEFGLSQPMNCFAAFHKRNKCAAAMPLITQSRGCNGGGVHILIQ